MGNQSKSPKRANDGFTAPAQSKTTAKTEKKKVSISVISMILVFALFLGVIVYTKVADSGFFYRNTVSVSSENYEVNNAMLSYYFNTQYQQYASYLQQNNIDTSKNLKDVMYTADRSWFDFIMEDMTIPQVKQTLILCEAAKAAGFELSDHDKEHIDEAVKSIEEMAEQYAKQQGGTKTYYIRAMYGYGVNMGDIRDAIELSQIASAYYESLMDSYDYTEADWNKYLEDEEHLRDIKVIDYISYTFSADDLKKDAAAEDTTGTAAEAEGTETEAVTTVETETEVVTTLAETEAETEADTADTEVGTESPDGTTTTAADKKEELTPEKIEAAKLANAIAQEMMAQNDTEKAREHFDAKIREHLENVVYASETDADKKKESVDSAMDATFVENAKYNENNEFIKSAFGDKSKLHNNIYVDENNDTGKYTIYMLLTEPELEEYFTKNYRVIAVTAADGSSVTDARDAIIKEFEDGGKTEEKFAELAKTHSADASAHETGGLVENTGKDEIQIEEIKEWLYADGRTAGEYTSVSNGSTGTEEVIYIVYYIGDGLKKWQKDVNDTMMNDAYTADYEKFEAAYAVETDLNAVYKIPGQAGL